MFPKGKQLKFLAILTIAITATVDSTYNSLAVGQCPNTGQCSFRQFFASARLYLSKRCSSDFNCLNIDEKCCTDACYFKYCQKFNRGECPTLKPDAIGICVEKCSSDSMCPKDQRCCSNGCGRVCTKTVKSEIKPGNCPISSNLFGICIHNCENDSECPGDKKCCSNGCGHECFTPAG